MFERPLHAEERATSRYRNPTTNSSHRGASNRHPSTKSVKICDRPGDPEQSEDGPSVPDEEVIRRQSTGSISSVANRRLSTGTDQTPIAPITADMGIKEKCREKAYRSDGDHPFILESDMGETARSLLRHDPQTRRHCIRPCATC